MGGSASTVEWGCASRQMDGASEQAGRQVPGVRRSIDLLQISA
jgi:hypothetical protein